MLSTIITFVGLTVIVKFLIENTKTILQHLKLYLLQPKIDLKSKYGEWAVITGATEGIGKAYAFELAQKGLNIVLISRNLEKLERLSKELRSSCGCDVKIVVADFSKIDIYEGIEKEIEDLDIGVLLNNVGVQYTHPKYFGEVPNTEVKDMLNINLTSMLMMTRLVLPIMLRKRRGCIVNLSSGSNMQPLPLMNMYAASKSFILYFSEALRFEYNHYGITVQTVSPFYVSTMINHFSEKLRQVNLFIPDAQTYVRHAVDTIGVVDHTTGYWPHTVQRCITYLIPEWARSYFGGLMYKQLRYDYLKKLRDRDK